MRRFCFTLLLIFHCITTSQKVSLDGRCRQTRRKRDFALRFESRRHDALLALALITEHGTGRATARDL